MTLFSSQYLEECKIQNIEETSTDNLINIDNIKINGADTQTRLLSFIEQIKNPYHYRKGKTIVKISFTDSNNNDLSAMLINYFRNLKNNN